MDDIDLWELNEAFAVQALYCADELGIPVEKMKRDFYRSSLWYVRRAHGRSRPHRR